MIQNNTDILHSNVYCQDAVRSYAERSGYCHHLFYSRSRLKWTKGGGLQAKFNDKGFLSRDISVKEMIEHRGDIHHIFPRQYLKENGFSRSQYNQVANYVYVQQENKEPRRKQRGIEENSIRLYASRGGEYDP